MAMPRRPKTRRLSACVPGLLLLVLVPAAAGAHLQDATPARGYETRPDGALAEPPLLPALPRAPREPGVQLGDTPPVITGDYHKWAAHAPRHHHPAAPDFGVPNLGIAKCASLAPEPPSLDVGLQQRKGCSSCRADVRGGRLVYGLCRDTYGAGWKALLCRRCGTDFKKSRAGVLSETDGNQVEASATAERRAPPGCPRAGFAPAPGGAAGVRAGVRGKKMQDVFGDTLLLLNRRCHKCTRFATYGPPGGKRHDAVHCAQHRDEEEADLVSNKCRHQGCSSHTMYGDPCEDQVPRYCAKHRATHHVDLKSRKCRMQGCAKRATFSVNLHRIPLSCAKHKDDLSRLISEHGLGVLESATVGEGGHELEGLATKGGSAGESSGRARQASEGAADLKLDHKLGKLQCRAPQPVTMLPVWRCRGPAAYALTNLVAAAESAQGASGAAHTAAIAAGDATGLGYVCMRRPCYGEAHAVTCAHHRQEHFTKVYVHVCQHPEGCRRRARRVETCAEGGHGDADASGAHASRGKVAFLCHFHFPDEGGRKDHAQVLPQAAAAAAGGKQAHRNARGLASDARGLPSVVTWWLSVSHCAAGGGGNEHCAAAGSTRSRSPQPAGVGHGKRKRKRGRKGGAEGAANCTQHLQRAEHEHRRSRNFSREAVRTLETAYAANARPCQGRKRALALQLHLRPSQVTTWFLNKRKRLRRSRVSPDITFDASRGGGGGGPSGEAGGGQDDSGAYAGPGAPHALHAPLHPPILALSHSLSWDAAHNSRPAAVAEVLVRGLGILGPQPPSASAQPRVSRV